MKQNRRCIIVVFYLISMLFGACESDSEKKISAKKMLEIRTEVDKRVAAFKKRETEKCNQAIMADVDAKVDTLLMFTFKELMKKQAAITVPAPPRPSAPVKPELIQPTDNTPLQPLIDNTKLKEEIR